MSKPKEPESKEPVTRTSRSSIYQQAVSEFWEVHEFARLAVGCDWLAREAELSPAQVKRVRTIEASANRSIQANTLRYRATPREWLDWAEERAIAVPERLRAAVEAYARERAPDGPAQAEAGAERARPVSALSKERHTMLRLIGGLIRCHYGALSQPFETGRRVADDLAEIPLAIDTDTVAKYIALAAAELAESLPKKG